MYNIVYKNPPFCKLYYTLWNNVDKSQHYDYIWGLMLVNMSKNPKVLVLGDGLLGSEIIKQTGWEYLSLDKDGWDVVSDFYEMGK